MAGIVFVKKTKDKLQDLEEDRARWMRELRKTSPGSERYRDVELMIKQIDFDIEKVRTELDGSPDSSRLSSIETAGILKKQTQKGETIMIETQTDKRNFAQWCQLKDEKARIKTDQKIWPRDSVNFLQNKNRLKKVDEQMTELREVIPKTYFSPNFPLTGGINKIDQGDQVVHRSSDLKQDKKNLADQMESHKDDPNFDFNGARKRMSQLADQGMLDEVHHLPRRTNRLGEPQ